MLTESDLRKTLMRINGRGYRAYRDIRGNYELGAFRLSVDHVQGDPFASPSRMSVYLESRKAGFPTSLARNKIRSIALADFLTRSFHLAIYETTQGRRGTGHSGLFEIDCGGQEVLEANSIIIQDQILEVRFTVGLPAAGRTILGHQAEEMLLSELPRIVHQSLCYQSLDPKTLESHIQVVEDQEALRNQLSEHGLLAFVANGASLPRLTGADDQPMIPTSSKPVIAFKSPHNLEVELCRPNRGSVRGMGLRPGVNLIVGGGFHGKSTLLKALERGVYNHVPGDGRDGVVTIESALKIRAEDGRYVEKLDLSPFIHNLPLRKKTKTFTTENASGSTSQAASILEALEMGCQLLIIDEDTSATNFLVRDARMQSLVAKSKEPITPFIDKVSQVFQDYGTSTILAMGGSGEYFDVADCVIMMDEYRPIDVSSKVRSIVEYCPSLRKQEGGNCFGTIEQRRPLANSFDTSWPRNQVKVKINGLGKLRYDNINIDLSALEQLVDTSQTRSIGYAISYLATHYFQTNLTLKEGLFQLMKDLDKKGLEILSPFKVGNLARPRKYEVGMAINRMRTFLVEAKTTT